MPTRTQDGPLSRLFRPATSQANSSTAQLAALDAASPEQLAALALAEGEEPLRVGAIERLAYGEPLRRLAGLVGGGAASAAYARLAQQRVAKLIDEQAIPWARLRAESESSWVLVQIADLCSEAELLEQAIGAVEDPQQLTRVVLESASSRARQLAAQRIGGREDLNRLLKQLQGKDKSVYRILKDKRDALRAESHKAGHIEQDIRTIYTSLEALLSRPYDNLFLPALEHFEARWRTLEDQAQPWARERTGAAIERCHALLADQRREAERQTAQLAERSEREKAIQRAREEADAHMEAAAREQREVESLAAAHAEEVRQAEEQARGERRAADALAFRQISTLMARAHGALRAGQTGPAAGLRRAIEEKLTAERTLPPALVRGLQELDSKLHALKEWKDYAVSPKRAELIADMESLAGSTEPPKKLAERIKDLRAQWKTISQGVLVDSEADWQRFNQAALAAYEPCRAYFETQAKLRAENLEKRGHVLERLRAFEAKQSGEQPDWRSIGAVLHEAPEEWRRIGPVDRRAVRAIEEEFDASLGRLRDRLEAQHIQNAADKRALIERAKGLLDHSDGREATERAKILQRQWREIGPASRDEEPRLWHEFRTQCDSVFKKREEAHAEHAAVLESHRAQALALCEEIEQRAAQSGAALLEGAKSEAQWRDAFEAVGELPRATERALYERFKRGLAQCELKVRAQRAHQAAQVFEDLIEATRGINAYGWAVANEAHAEECESLKSAAEMYIAGIVQWPKGGASVLKNSWAKAESARREHLESNEATLRQLCIRAEIATDRPTPSEDIERRRNYQLQRLVQSMGQGQGQTVSDWGTLAREWSAVGPVAPEVYASLLMRFRQCRT